MTRQSAHDIEYIPIPNTGFLETPNQTLAGTPGCHPDPLLPAVHHRLHPNRPCNGGGAAGTRTRSIRNRKIAT